MRPIISASTRIRYPEHFVVGDGSIIDDFCYFSTRVSVGRGSHVASSCTIAGGVEHQFQMGDFSSLSAGVRIWCSSNDFAEDLVCLLPPGLSEEAAGVRPVAGDVRLGDYTGVGANSIIMPANLVPEGTVIGALSFVPTGTSLEPWSVYAGIPVRLLKPRARDHVLGQAQRLREALEQAPD